MSNQPKWAWWVVGIVIPVIGIVVSIQLATKSDSGDTSQPTNTAPRPPATAGPNTAAATGPSASQAADAPAKVLAGPLRLTFNEDATYVDLDSAKPFPQGAGKGADVSVTLFPGRSLGPPRSGDVVALAPTEGEAPTRDDCRGYIAKNGTYSSGELAQDMRICIQTDEGRIAYLRITTVPSLTAVTLEATVWE